MSVEYGWAGSILRPSPLLWQPTRCSAPVNHVSLPPPPRLAAWLADGRLGSPLPALWVCLRQMGLCIHLLAPCLPTVRSAQVFLRSTRCVPGPLVRHGDFVSHAAFFPRDVGCGRATTLSPRLAILLDWTKETFPPLFCFCNIFFFNCYFVSAHWELRGQCLTAQCAQVRTALLSGDWAEAAPGFSIVVIDLNLETKVSELLELVCSMTCKVGSEVIFGEL